MKKTLKYPGSKWRVASWIIKEMPDHHSYVEPYFGSGGVFFNKPTSKIETINDMDNRVVNLFKIIRDDPLPLIRALELTPYARNEYENTYTTTAVDATEMARQFLLQCWQGHGFRTNGYRSGWKNDVQGREAAYAMRDWYRLPGWISETVERLREVQIECRPAVDVISRFNHEKVVVYADTPYLLSTRNKEQYKHEMSEQQHIELLEALLNHKGTAIVSGYDSDLYNEFLKGWSKKQINTLAEKGLPRTETIWIKR